MSYWNYRIMRKRTNLLDNHLEITEVYYDDNGIACSFGQAPVPYGQTKKEIRDTLLKMLESLDKDIIDQSYFDKNKNE